MLLRAPRKKPEGLVRVDYSHPLGRHLARAFLFNNTYRLHDVIDGSPPNSKTGVIYNSAVPAGSVVRTDSSSSVYAQWAPIGSAGALASNAAGPISLPNATVLLGLQWRSGAVDWATGFGLQYSGTDYAALTAYGGSDIYLDGYIAGDYVYGGDPWATGPPVGTPIDIGIRITANQGDRMYVGGAFHDTVGNWESSTWYGGLFFGNSSTIQPALELRYCLVLDLSLPDEIICGLQRNPYELFARKVSRTYSLPLGPTLQYARPNSDVTDGDWYNQSGSQTNLYQSIDEVTPSSADYIFTGYAANHCQVGLSAISDPGVHTGHVVEYEADGDGATDLVVSLYQSTTLIAQWTETDLSSTMATYEHTLTAGEAAAITSYAALELRFDAAT